MKEKVKDEAYLNKLRMILERHYCLTFSTAEECLSVVERETTVFNTTALEEVVTELDCTQAQRGITKFKRSFSTKSLCYNPAQNLSHSATVETLSILIDYSPDTPNAIIENLLLSIFGDLYGDVVRCHGVSSECIVCYFPPVDATLLINEILDKFSLFKEEKVKMITVGYCKVYDEFFYDKV